MIKEYKTIQEIASPLMIVKNVEGVTYDELAEIGKSFGYEYWERVDETHSGVRFCASWATTQENVDALRAAVQALKK